MISQEEWEDYEEYLHDLSQEELKIELQWLASVGEAKRRGSFIVPNESYYDMWGNYVTQNRRISNT